MRASLIAILLTVLTLLAGCQKEGADLDRDEAFYSMVTVVDGSAESGTTFEMLRYADAPAVTLVAPSFYNSDFKKGARVMLYYFITDSSSSWWTQQDSQSAGQMRAVNSGKSLLTDRSS